MNEDELPKIEKHLQRLRDRIQQALTEVERALLELRSTARFVDIQAENARNAANEALADIRHINGQLRNLTTAASTKPSPETHPATARSRSRGSRA